MRFQKLVMESLVDQMCNVKSPLSKQSAGFLDTELARMQVLLLSPISIELILCVQIFNILVQITVMLFQTLLWKMFCVFKSSATWHEWK